MRPASWPAALAPARLAIAFDRLFGHATFEPQLVSKALAPGASSSSIPASAVAMRACRTSRVTESTSSRWSAFTSGRRVKPWQLKRQRRNRMSTPLHTDRLRRLSFKNIEPGGNHDTATHRLHSAPHVSALIQQSIAVVEHRLDRCFAAACAKQKTMVCGYRRADGPGYSLGVRLSF